MEQASELKSSILVIDDELSMREFLDVMLSKAGYDVSTAASGKEAIAMLESAAFDLLICDIRLGDISGIEVLKKAKELYSSDIVAIMISAYSTTEAAVEAMNEGAYDYVPKPFDNNELKKTIADALAAKTIEQEKEILDDELQKHLHFGKLVGNSPQMMKIYTMIKQVAKTKTSILVSGESGTGKEFIARAIHDQSDRKDFPFIVVNCGGIPETLMESELFGHTKGALPPMIKKGFSNWRTKALSFSTRSGSFRFRCRSSCCARSRSACSSRLAAQRISRSISGSFRRQTRISKRK
jgi:two-component system response regulator PilR (NtrC family)